MAEGQNPRIFHPDGSLKKIEEAHPSRFTVLGEKSWLEWIDLIRGLIKDSIECLEEKESSGRPAGPIVRPSQATEAMRSEIAGSLILALTNPLLRMQICHIIGRMITRLQSQ